MSLQNTSRPSPSFREWFLALEESLEPWELEELENKRLLEDAFSGELRFGTGGIRALMGVGPNRMNLLTIGKVAQGLSNWLGKMPGETSVVIGYDTRSHSREFAEVTARVLAANGIHSFLFGDPQPTPVLDFAVCELGCSAGVAITASHNPREYNGFKVYGPDGVQATDAMARAIQAEIELADPFESVQTTNLNEAFASGLASYVDSYLIDTYHKAILVQRFGVDCSGVRVVYSPLNGTGLVHAEEVMRNLGVAYSLVREQSEPDGDFASCPKPNPENRNAMAAGMAQMAAEGADLFLANDPDADRLGVACMDGDSPRLLTGNEVGLLLLDYACRHSAGKGGRPVAVTTVVTSPLADAISRANGVELRRTLTGFKYIGEQIGRIQTEGREFLLGIEESCGYLRGSYVRDKDGICALMLVCELAAHYKKRRMTLVDALECLNVRYGHELGRQLTCEFLGATGMASMERLMGSLRAKPRKAIAGVPIVRTIDYLHGAPMPTVGPKSGQMLPPSNVLEWCLVDGSRVLVRPSGTEPKLKAYVFAKARDISLAEEVLEDLSTGVNELLNQEMKLKGESVIHVVLLSGGSGTRLWPLSNSARSKQFLKVLRDADGNHVSMVQRVFGQIDAVDASIDITIATSANQVDALSMQVGGRYQLSVEPERRDTAPAIMLACAHLDLVQGADSGDPVIVMPIDSFAEQSYYDRIPLIAETICSGKSDLVLLGVEPTYPSEKYGYILPESKHGDVRTVTEFREKPNAQVAEKCIARGGLWNCGVFGFRLGWLRELTEAYVDVASFDELVERYRELPRNSFDYEVVEKANRVSVIPYAGAWKDLGTWNTLSEEMANETSGAVWMDGPTTRNVHAVNETGLPMVVAGISDAVVVATPDGILVSSKDASSHIKGVVEAASSSRHMYERRVWGRWRVISSCDSAEGSHSLTRELVVLPGRQMSYQSHKHRADVWTVVSGTGEVVVEGEITSVAAGDTVQIGARQRHSVLANTELRIIEVQLGRLLAEEDIERFGYFWGMEENLG